MDLNQTYISSKQKIAEKLSKTTLPKNSEREERNRIPKGQRVSDKMVAMAPITYEYPHIGKDEWSLQISGLVENIVTLNWKDLMALPQKDFQIDFHCVTKWSKLDQKFTGVDFAEIIKMAKPKDNVRYVIFESFDGYITNVLYKEILENSAFIAVTMDGADIPEKHGGPARMIIPHLYGWKSAKFLCGIRFQSNDEPGFWETRGYNNHGDPWKEERYS